MFSEDIVRNTLNHWFARRSDISLVPENHYFHTWLALSAFESGQPEKGLTLLCGFFKLGRKGHPEFNKQALIYVFQRHWPGLPVDLAARVESFIRDRVYSVDFKTRTGNNWLVLRMLLHLKLYSLFKDQHDLQQFRDFFKYVQDLEEEGLFCDFPPPGEQDSLQKAFPLTYSFKMLALFMECLDLLRTLDMEQDLQTRLEGLVKRAIPVHLSFIAPDGEALYYGRSDNTLFGYASVLHVLSMLKAGPGVNRLIKSVSGFIQSKFVDSGVLVRCMPYTGFRDSYIYDSVYTAYFLGRVLLLNDVRPVLEYEPGEPRPVQPSPAGVIVRSKDFFVFITTTGCTIPDKGSDFNGYRYTGLTPMKVWSAGNQDSTVMSLNRGRIEKSNPQLPFLPIIKGPGFRLLPYVFKLSQAEVHGQGFLLRGEASPVLVLTNGFVRRVLRRLGRRISFFKKSLVGLKIGPGLFRIKRSIHIQGDLKKITMADTLGPGTFEYLIPDNWEIQGDRARIVKSFEGMHQLRTSRNIQLVYNSQKNKSE